MIIYCDASVIVTALVTEPFSDDVRAFLTSRPKRQFAISPWVGTEVASALARKQRQGVLTVEQRAALTANWAAIAGASTRTAIEDADFDLAAKLVDAGPRGLRSGDALHLALVRRAGLAIATLDRDLADAAEAIAVKVALRPPA